MTGTFLAFFIYHEYSSTKDELAQSGEVIAKLLATTLQTPVYIGDNEAVRSHLVAGARNKGVSCIKVYLPDGTEYVSEPLCRHNNNVVTADANIVIDQSLSPEAAIAGVDPGSTVVGKVVVHMDYEGRKRESLLVAVPILGAGLLLWMVATYLGYLLMRRLTSSLDQLVEGMAAIERGDSRQIEADFFEHEFAYLTGAINDMSEALHAREEENLSLQQELLNQMESRVVHAEETMHAKLTEANKLSSLGTMASYMAHEINNPVGTMILNLDLLKDAFEDSREILAEHYRTHGDFTLGGLDYHEYDETMPYLIDEMRNGAQRIKRIVEDLKRFAKNESADMKENVNINSVVMSAVRLTSRKVRSSTDNLELDLTDPIPAVRGNAQQLEQVLINLIINACQALPDMNRKIALSTSNDQQTRQVVVIVKDEGEGIAAALIPHLTDPFFTTKRDRGGTGVGLAITAKIIKEHGGAIKFESDVGKGMTVTISLPIASEMS
ncbi:hypothetical protein A2G06_16440 (plasmid) [Geobacter anodireducens]|nr:hypothetical protein A2G06_16440 [Geobacter anodireducens]